MVLATPDSPEPPAGKSQPGEDLSSRYRRLWLSSVFFTAFVSLTPLVVMTFVNFTQYRRTLTAEMVQPISHLASNSRRFLEDFLEARRAALIYVANRETYEDLCDGDHLGEIFLNMKDSFGGFVDLGVIDARGRQRSYAGPHRLEGKDYSEQAWYHEASLKGVYVSDVFLGYRNFPHFVIAVRKDSPGTGGFYILRATIDTDVLSRHITSLELRPSSDAFLMNHHGILQTPTRYAGGILAPAPIATPPPSARTEVANTTDREGKTIILGYAYIKKSPFVFVVLAQPEDVAQSWLELRSNLLWVLGGSVVIIIAVILGSCTYLVNRIREADLRRDTALKNVAYTNKMASIGRMAAGVAHEINNPLAIINENAGLLRDLSSMGDQSVDRDRLLKVTSTIVKSVERCSAITHRLLGFAKRMDPLTERIALGSLLEEVVGFHGKEPDYRNISINLAVPEDLPIIQSDRGQLQQVFLNILSNAMAAVDDGGHIDISAELENEDSVAITISDNGPGIPKEHLSRIFEPFFTTKAEYGTGLGLSITFGIVQKLGGQLAVRSEPGQGASFTVRLPIISPA